MVFEPVERAQGPASLTSDPGRFSDDAWDLLLASQDTARRWRHGAMDVEHLLQTLLVDPRFGPWIEAWPIDTDRLLDRLEAFCADQPTSSAPDLYIGDALEDLLDDADLFTGIGFVLDAVGNQLEIVRVGFLVVLGAVFHGAEEFVGQRLHD